MKLISILYFLILFLFQFLSETRGNQIRVALFMNVHHTGYPSIPILYPGQKCLLLDGSERKASSVKLVEGSCVRLCTIHCQMRRHLAENCFVLTSDVNNVEHLQRYNDQLQSIRRCVADDERFRYFMDEDELEGSSRDERQRPGPGQGRELRQEKQSRRYYYSHKVPHPIKHSDNSSDFPRKRRHRKLDRYLYNYMY